MNRRWRSFYELRTTYRLLVTTNDEEGVGGELFRAIFTHIIAVVVVVVIIIIIIIINIIIIQDMFINFLAQ
jgi:hypothetical protein